MATKLTTRSLPYYWLFQMNLTRIHLEIFCRNWINAEFVQDILTNISLRWYHQSGVRVKEGMGRI